MFRSPEQTQFHAVLAAHQGRPLLLEGAAGLGKTRAILLAAKEAPRAVVAVPTRALAAQMAKSADAKAVGVSPTVYAPEEKNRAAARAADLMICTHVAALLDVMSGGLLLGLRERDLVVFDEADQLPDMAALLKDETLPAGVELARALVDDDPEVRDAARSIRRALEDPRWWQRIGQTDDDELALRHIGPARMLRALFDHPRLAFVSATISVGGTFDAFRRSLGLTEVAAASRIIEPRHHGTLEIVAAKLDHTAPDFLARAALHIKDIDEGTTLVITTSHADAAALGNLLTEAVVRAPSETVGQAVARMGSARTVIAAGAWAGLDTPVRWRHIVMLKAPYSPPTVIDGEALTSFMDSRVAAVRRFRQGLARGLRTPDAYCTLHLLDARFERSEFITAIPARFAVAAARRFGIAEFRTRQQQFRALMFEKWGGRCVVTGCDVPAMLEAAHAGPKGGWRTNHQEGWLLRADLHRALDAGLLELDGDGNVVRVEAGVMDAVGALTRP